MMLYFPEVKISKCDLIPSERNSLYILHLKSQKKSPPHYPNHPLIEGKVEFVGKVNNNQDIAFWLKEIFGDDNPKNAKGKTISVLVDFTPEQSTKFCLLGIGKKNDFAYFFFNKNCSPDSEEMKAKFNYDLNKKNIQEKKKVKI